ncbi:coniferyl aldehyde dehydrogenase [Zhongshania guokunii]|uniref:Aldehyde dehydrogenase n=1 Tax=Zhongshania guokunii TaxID=641783 RepID=A0ABV3U2F8_9GAMM
MNSVAPLAENPTSDFQSIKNAVDLQRASFLAEGYPSAKTRIDRLDRLIAMLRTNKQKLAATLKADYSARSHFDSVVFDILVPIESLKYCRKNTAKWMRPEKRGAKFPLNVLGADAHVFYQPLGVVGIVAPWNFPIQLTFSPLGNAISAGNRAIIKPSELTPATSELLAELFTESFSPEEITVVNGGPEVASAFTSQAFDHLVFTGAPSVAKHVMRAAAENLVPLTLELGGKCPVIIGEGADLKAAVERIFTFKTMNAGQICLAPDYTFVKKEVLPEFIRLAKNFVSDNFGHLANNDDYGSIINARHRARIASYIQEAKSKGFETIPLSDDIGLDALHDHHKLAPTLVIDPSDDCKIMSDEIFGPAMPIKTYSDISTVVGHINAGERPLALYYFGKSQSEINLLKYNTTSGGMVVNDIAAHVLQDTMPLGGVGHSGMGSYHGFDGFRQLSHGKGYYKQGLLSLTPFFKAPHTDKMLALLEKMMG